MSGANSDSGQSSFSTSQSVGTALLANLFGQGTFFGKEGVGFLPQGKNVGFNDAAIPNFQDIPGASGFGQAGAGGGGTGQAGFDFANQVFQPGDFNILGDLVNPQATNVLQQQAEGIAGSTLEGLGGRIRDFRETAAPTINEALTTGFRTDLQPIVAEEQRRFSRETIPDLAERFSGLTGGFSSDFANSLASAGTDLGVRLGSQQVAADEAANARRQQALTIAPASFAAIEGLAPSLGADIAQTGGGLQNAAFQARPEVQLLNTLTSIFSAAQPTQGATSFGTSNAKSGGA